MATLDIIEAGKKKVGSVSLTDALLSEKVNKAVLYQAVRANLSADHHGTVDTKTRAEVLRTGKKLHKQKGTGGARHGSRKSSPFVGGGRVFGPHQRDYTIRLPRKVRQLAMKEVFKELLQQKKVLVVKDLPFKEAKTKVAAKFLSSLDIKGGLVVVERATPTVEKSVRNIKGFKVLKISELSVVELLRYQNVVLTENTFDTISKRYLA